MAATSRLWLRISVIGRFLSASTANAALVAIESQLPGKSQKRFHVWRAAQKVAQLPSISIAGEGVLSFRVVRSAEARWQGTVPKVAAGLLSAAVPLLALIRCGLASEEGEPATNPEELLGAADASCSSDVAREPAQGEGRPPGSAHHRQGDTRGGRGRLNIARHRADDETGDVPGITDGAFPRPGPAGEGLHGRRAPWPAPRSPSRPPWRVTAPVRSGLEPGRQPTRGARTT